MEIIKPSALTLEFLNSGPNGIPLFICTDAPRTKRKLDEAGFNVVRINTLLAKSLLNYPVKDRPKHIESELKELLNYHVPILITDFEMLFDPRYEIDVIKFFCEKARIINVAVKWPGKCADGQLIYAEPECADYHKYNCDSYQIRIVQ